MIKKFMTREEIFESVSKNFEFLIPRDVETTLLILLLHTKIEDQEMEDTFTQKDFEDAVDEVTFMLKRERGIQKESISKRLSQHFYTTIKIGEDYCYQLTIFAKEFANLIMNKVEPNYENLELVHTFKRTLPVQDEDLSDIVKFNYWYKNHYSASKKFIFSHIENLQLFVDRKVAELRSLLKPNSENAKELIDQFLIIFEQLGVQTEGVTKALHFKQDVLDKIKNAEPLFKEEKESWEQYDKIQNEVLRFFDAIDVQVININDKIQHARTRLKSLYDNLRYKQQYKLKVEKFLLMLLRHSKTVDEKIVLPSNIKKKETPYFRDKFMYPPLIDFGEYHRIESPFYQEDEEFKRLSELEKTKQLSRQENALLWTTNIRTEIELGREVKFEQWLDKILESEQNLEVPIDVCFNLIDEYKNRNDVELEIEKKLVMPLRANIALWKLKIKQTETQ